MMTRMFLFSILSLDVQQKIHKHLHIFHLQCVHKELESIFVYQFKENMENMLSYHKFSLPFRFDSITKCKTCNKWFLYIKTNDWPGCMNCEIDRILDEPVS